MVPREVKFQCKVSAAISVEWTMHRECQNKNTLATVFTLWMPN
jgi:hypothetical protein